MTLKDTAVVRFWHFHCTECGFGDVELGHLAEAHDAHCTVCLIETGSTSGCAAGKPTNPKPSLTWRRRAEPRSCLLGADRSPRFFAAGLARAAGSFFAAADAAALSGRFAGVAGEAFLQRRDQVDHGAAVGRLPVFRPQTLALRHRLDHRP